MSKQTFGAIMIILPMILILVWMGIETVWYIPFLVILATAYFCYFANLASGDR